MSSQRSFLLGLFFLVTLCVLGYYTLFLTDFTLFKSHPEIAVHFSKTNGLREGDAVLVAGMRWGRVKRMIYDPKAPMDRRITVTASLDDPLVLRDGFKIEVEDATLLGGHNLAIDPGPADAAPIPPDRDLFGGVAPNPLDALGSLVRESQKGVTQFVDDLSDVAHGIRAGKGVVGKLLTDEQMATDLANAVSNASQTLATVQRMTRDMEAGKGSVGQLLVNAQLYDELKDAAHKLSTTLDEATALARDARTGNGVVGRLLEDPTMGADLAQAVGDVQRILAKVNTGQGTVGRLINDDTIAKNVEDVTMRLSKGEGSLGAFLVKNDVYDNVRQITEDTAVVTGAIRSGQGSFGRMIMDDELYRDVKIALRIVERALEEYREAAPITTFTSVFFSAF
jgi:phospholipid/cholesterol/gamma-HCH transport system substrate-binding protein